MGELPPDLAAAARLGGEAGRCFASFDWERHPLGPPTRWPEAIRTMVAVSLTSRFPVVLWIGDDLTMVYNDGYIPMLADKHPWAMGTPGLDVWWEIREIIEPMLAGVLSSGIATWSNDLLLPLVDQGRPWEKYFTFTYSPIFLHEGNVGGVFCAVEETTQRVIGERRLRVLSTLGTALVDAKSIGETVAATVRACEEQSADLPFVAIYLGDSSKAPLALEGASSLVAGLLNEVAPTAAFWCDPLALPPTGLQVPGLERRLPGLVEQFGQGCPETALILPLVDSGSGSSMGVIVVGLNPLRPFDEQYQGFCRLLADQVVAGIASAQAYEAERERARSLAELDRAKTLFLTNVSHELRTPLTLILGPVEDALALVGDDPVLQAHLEIVDRSARRLLRLVNSLLDFARIEAGRASAHLVAVEIGTLTADIASSFSDICRRAGIDLVIDCRPAIAHVDPDMWETIVLNLLSNAFKFTFSGSITVRVAPSDAGAIVLSVADTGVGISPAEQSRIFERFYRSSVSNGRTLEGSGIGLALVQSLIELHGGQVGVTSKEGSGTTFSVVLPATSTNTGAAPSPAMQVSVRSESVYVNEAAQWIEYAPEGLSSDYGMDGPPVSALSRPLVLVADDNSDLRAHLERVIGSRWSVVSAGDGEHALELVDQLEPDLVIADVMMPKIDGFELIKRIRANPRLESIPVVLLSARAGSEAAGEGFKAGADDYLVKPFRSTELLNRVAARLKLATRDRERRERERSELHRAAVLAELGASLSAAGGPQEIAESILRSPFAAGGLSSVALGVTDESAGLLRMTYAGSLSAEISDRYHAISVDAPVPVGEVVKTGKPLLISDTRELDPVFDSVVTDVASFIRAALIEPLRAPDGSVIGVLSAHWAEPQNFDDLDVALAHELAGLAARAVGRVQRAEREHQVAVALQERLLDWGAHSVPAAIWTTYQPASDMMRVGGDWYTITSLDDEGRIGISVGDVVGHGLPAATVMSELRSALAAASLALQEPDEVLSLLESYAKQVPGAQCTTAAYVLADPRARSIRYACAGHPYPILVSPDGHARLLDRGRRQALSSHLHRFSDTQGSVGFEPGSLLILYTDGLIERRGESLDVGLERLLDAAQGLVGRSVGEVCSELLASLRGPSGFEDDVVLVAMRPCGSTTSSYVDAFPALIAEIPGVRAGLRTWLEGRGIDRDTIWAVLVSTGEAIANAVEHGSRSDVRCVVTLEAFVTEAEIVVTVTDSGRWITDSADSRRAATRGRGITLMHGMSDDVAFHRDERGTRVTIRHRR